MKQSRVVSATITVVIAMVAFISFGAGYMTRPIPVAGATPHPLSSMIDGNPVGFSITDKATSLQVKGSAPSCFTHPGPCGMTVAHSTRAAFTCSSSYCASYKGKIVVTVYWSDGHTSNQTYPSYGLISSP
jgi:hypothetical protein